MDKPIIEKRSDIDKYKLTMGYVFFREFSDLLVKYKFKNRSDINLLPYMDEIKEQLKHLCTLKFTESELQFIHKRNPQFSKAYIEFLRNNILNYDYLDIRKKELEYKREAFGMFENLLQVIREEIVQQMFRITTVISSRDKLLSLLPQKLIHKELPSLGDAAARQAGPVQQGPVPMARPLPSPAKADPVTRRLPKVGRNDACPCGSGRKYKKCCGS